MWWRLTDEVVIDELGYGWRLRADRAFRVTLHLDRFEAHLQGLEKQQTTLQQLSFAEDELEAFGSLDDPDGPCHSS